MREKDFLRLNDLVIAKYNVRAVSGDLTTLKDDIKKRGIINPLTVKKVGNKYEVIAGSRRFLAAKELELETVPVIIVEMTDLEALQLSYKENQERQNLQPEDEIKAYELAIEELNKESLANVRVGQISVYGASVAQKCADFFGVTVHTVYTRLNQGRILKVLEKGGLHVKRKERWDKPTQNALSYRQADKLSAAFDSQRTRHILPTAGLSEEEIDNKKIELAKIIAPLPWPKTKRVLDEFRRNPLQPLDQILGKTKVPKVKILYLSEDNIQKLEKLRQEKNLKDLNEVLSFLFDVEKQSKDYFRSFLRRRKS